MMLASLSARPRTSAWPISPPAPVISTTALRMVTKTTAGGRPGQSARSLHDLRKRAQAAPRLGVLADQGRQIERDVLSRILRRDRLDGRPDLLRVGLRVVVFDQAVVVLQAERIEKRAHHLAVILEVVDDEAACGKRLRQADHARQMLGPALVVEAEDEFRAEL